MRGHDLSNRVARLERRVAYLLQFAPKTVTAGAAAFALTGSAATLINSAKFLDAGAASYALTGQTATLRRSRVVSAGAATFALSGQTASLAKGLSLVATAAAYALSGTDAGFVRTRLVAAEVGAFALTGQDATLGGATTIVADSASYALTGGAVGLLHGYRVAAAAGSFALTGQAASVLRRAKVAAAAGSFALTGQAATLSIGVSADLTLFAVGSSSGTTVTVPTGIANGDLAVLVDRGYLISGTPTAVTPSGYTSRANVAATDGNQRVVVTTKILTTADSGATVTGMSSDDSRKILMVFRHVSGIATVTASTVTSTYSNASDPSAASASYTGLSNSSITLGILAAGFTATISSPSFSPTETGFEVRGNNLRAYYLLTDAGSNPGSVSVDQGNSGARNQNILLNLEVS